MRVLIAVVSIVCLLFLFCISEKKDCQEASGTKACDDLESNCNGDFNRVLMSGSPGTEKCTCCE